jgi:hypothetical protein
MTEHEPSDPVSHELKTYVTHKTVNTFSIRRNKVSSLSKKHVLMQVCLINVKLVAQRNNHCV